ncbi:MAG: 30S ribosomal protein S16 [Candidatus Staskawiczbacteria bacterium]
MLTIRLTRKGKKNQPFFRVIVIDKKRSASGGRAVEDLGYVNPITKKRTFNKERILYWISQGAQPSASIHNYLVAEKIIDAKKTKITNISKKKQAEIIAEKKAAEGPEGHPAPVVATPEVVVAPEEKPAA